MPRRQQILAVVIRQYGTGLYRTCISLGRENLAFIGSYADEQSANQRIAQFWSAYDRGEIAHPEDLQRLMSDQPPDSPLTEPQLLPLAA